MIETGKSFTRVSNDPLRRQLDRWVSAGLITTEQSDAIYRAEHQAEPPPPHVPLATEAVGYVGSALVLTAVGMITGRNWDSMPTAAHVVVLAVPTILVAVAGMLVFRVQEPSMRRLGSALWAMSCGGVGGTAAVVFVDVLGSSGDDVPDHCALLFIGTAIAVTATVEWSRHRMALQLFVMFGGLVAMTLGIVELLLYTRDTEFSSVVWSLPILTVGLAFTVGGLANLLEPTHGACLLGPAAILFGVQILRADQASIGVWAGSVLAGGLLAVGMLRDHPVVLVVGTIGVFIWTPQLALHYLRDTLGVEATLGVLGLVLIGVAVFVGRFWREREAPGA